MVFSLPFPVSKFLRYHVLKPFDIFYPKLRAEGLPPMSLNRYGGYSTNQDIARLFVDMLIKECGLCEGSVVLDIGCGTGLIAVPILNVIGPTGKLYGLDLIEESINWCKRNIQPTWPNSEFKHVAVFNASYNPTAKTSAKEYRFPYPNTAFDVVLLKSVFTHMRPAEVDNYLAEISRMMRPGGFALITFFLLDTETRRLIAEGRSSFDFSHEFENCMVVNPAIPEDAIAFEYAELMHVFEQCGLTLKRTLWGSWRGGGPAVGQVATSQDVLILKRN